MPDSASVNPCSSIDKGLCFSFEWRRSNDERTQKQIKVRPEAKTTRVNVVDDLFIPTTDPVVFQGQDKDVLHSEVVAAFT